MKKFILIFFIIANFSKFIFGQNVPAIDWVNQIEGPGVLQILSVDKDSLGNIYVTGMFEDTVDFDPGPGTALLESYSSWDIFIAKYDANGNYIWAKGIGSQKPDFGYGLKVDKAGNFYLACYINDTVDFDPGPSVHKLIATIDNDVIAKYSADGDYLWAKIFPASLSSAMNPIAIDHMNNLCVTGNFGGTQDFDWGNGTANLTTSSIEAFIAKYDAAGNYIWAKNIGGRDPYGIDTDPFGNVYVTGDFADTSDFDPGPGVELLISKSNYLDAFIAKYNHEGSYEWAKRIGGNKTDIGYCIIADESGNVFVSGTFQDTVDFDPGPGTDIETALFNMPNFANGDVFISKYDSSGNYYWTNQLATDSFVWTMSLVENQLGQIYMLGAFRDTVDFDPGPDTINFISSEGSSIYLIRYNPDGSYSWAGTIDEAWSFSLLIDNTGSLYISGSFENTTDFDMDSTELNLSSDGTHDIFIAKYSESIPTSNFYSYQNQQEFILYPNPTDGNFQIAFPTPNQEPTLLSITNILGEKLFEQEIPSDTLTQHIECSTWQKGIYIVTLQNKLEIEVKQLIIQ